MHYLSEKTPSFTLFPTDLKLRVDVLRWQSWTLAHFGASCDILIWENVLKNLLEGQSPDPRRVEQGVQDFVWSAAVLDEHLNGRKFLVGNQVTLADFSVAATLGYADAAKMPWEGFKNIKKWYATLETLDAWKKSAPSH
ncbi:MAG: glutathione S-transferase family protein [Bdellovibrionota bacterium]